MSFPSDEQINSYCRLYRHLVDYEGLSEAEAAQAVDEQVWADYRRRLAQRRRRRQAWEHVLEGLPAELAELVKEV